MREAAPPSAPAWRVLERPLYIHPSALLPSPELLFVPHAGCNTDGSTLRLSYINESGANGHCFYRACSRYLHGDDSRHLELRAQVCTYMEAADNWRIFADFAEVGCREQEYGGVAHRAAFLAYMLKHRREEYADEPQHLAVRQLYPDITLHVWYAAPRESVAQALRRLPMAHEHDAAELSKPVTLESLNALRIGEHRLDATQSTNGLLASGRACASACRYKSVAACVGTTMLRGKIRRQKRCSKPEGVMTSVGDTGTSRSSCLLRPRRTFNGRHECVTVTPLHPVCYERTCGGSV
jgi:hypothetical protein